MGNCLTKKYTQKVSSLLDTNQKICENSTTSNNIPTSGRENTFAKFLVTKNIAFQQAVDFYEKNPSELIGKRPEECQAPEHCYFNVIPEAPVYLTDSCQYIGRINLYVNQQGIITSWYS